MKANQEEVFDGVAVQAVTSALAGFNSTIFAYGQTGSGKTFTITGGAERYVDRGIIPRALSYIFNESTKNSERKITLYINYEQFLVLLYFLFCYCSSFPVVSFVPRHKFCSPYWRHHNSYADFVILMQRDSG